MHPQPLPLTRDIVLIGGGHAHALVLRAWAMDPLPGARLTVINPGPIAPYTGMLPGHIAGHYARHEMMIDLVPLVRAAGARLILGRVTGIDRAAGRVQVTGRAPVAYDVASVDIGIASDLPALPGFADHAVPAKPLGDYADRWAAFVARGLPAPRVVVIGGGVGGVELALASAHRLAAAGARPQVTVVERAATPLPGIGAGARAALLARAAGLGVNLLTGAEPARVAADAVHLADGRVLASDFTLGVAGARPQAWLADTGLDLVGGFLAVGPTLQTSDPAIFAAGDCAAMTHAPRPKAGVFAVRQAPVLHHNLCVAAGAPGALRPYRPQRDYLKLISTGGKGAVADKLGLRLSGGWLWRWKDRIDRRFMAMLSDLPAMPAPALPFRRAAGVAEALGDKPMCGGCGAKMGAADLRAALAGLPHPARPDVLAGPGDDAAVLTHAAGVQVLTTDHLRALTDDPWLMARIAAVHALGDVWAMGARPQAALTQVILPRMAPRMQAETLREILSAAQEVFGPLGADVVGGHTSVGAELTLGFAVTGLAPRVLGKGGLQPGDALVLTKPLGSGTIMAAAMQGVRLPGLLLGESVAAALASMSTPQGDWAAILAGHATAMTDVTGFGLAGHIAEMLAASGCGARVEAAALPLLPGAEALAAEGVASTLAPANWAAVPLAGSGPRLALMYDPQTGGGLLAGVPGDRAVEVLAALRAAGAPAAIIGRVTVGPVELVLA